MTVAGMAPMHEKMQQRAGEENKPGQQDGDMDPVLDQKGEGNNGASAIKAEQGPAGQGGGLHRDLPFEPGESKAGFVGYI